MTSTNEQSYACDRLDIMLLKLVPFCSHLTNSRKKIKYIFQIPLQFQNDKNSFSERYGFKYIVCLVEEFYNFINV